MVAIGDAVVLSHYDDGPAHPCDPEKERAFRRAFLAEAQRIEREWSRSPQRCDTDPPAREPDDLVREEEAARLRRQHLRERYTASSPGYAGHASRHPGYRPGHAVPAAELRGRHHAMRYVVETLQQGAVPARKVFESRLLDSWSTAVERWATAPLQPDVTSPPPRPLDTIVGRFLLRSLGAQPPAVAAPVPHPSGIRIDAVCLAEVQPEPVRWLWPGRIALGKLSLVAGEPGLGKSYLTLDMAARVSRGAGWPCSGGHHEPGGVVLLSAEDDIKDTIVPRLIAASADRRRIQAMRALYQPMPGLGTGVEKPVPFSLLEHLPQLEDLIRRASPCRLVIVDPVSAFLGSTDSHNNSEVRSVLAPLAELAARHRVAVVAVTHLNKGQGNALNRVIGSIAFTAAARAAYVVTRDEDDSARRLMLPAKNNLGCDTDGFAYRLEGEPTPHVEWEPMPVAMSADQAVGIERARGPEPDARRDAEAWLLEYLAAGPRPARDVYVDGARDGHTRDTIRRAKAVLKVKATKDGYQGGWVWTLPGSGSLMTGGDGGDSKGAAKGGKGGLP